MIRSSSEFTLDAEKAEQTGKSVLRRGKSTLGTVAASQVDAEFTVSGGYVLLLSYGDMFSAIETIIFVNGAGTIRDRLVLGGATEQGLITEIATEGADAITFAFPNNRRRRLRVARQSRFLGLGERWLHLD